jgi:molecular chaperone DnaK
MYLGIDLGTSNSAIVGSSGGTLRLFKTKEDKDTLPSVVMADRTGGRYVGERAYRQLQTAPGQVAARFKRLIGTSSTLSFGREGSISPEEASAEVLRTLRAQVAAAVGTVDIEGAVVTVPAAFDQLQSEATVRAARAAGLERVALLQEPVAAALAAMESSEVKTGLFLVYDLGGGTFDIALVRAVDGAVSIEAHEGINMLGGSDFDRMLVDAHVRPWITAKFDLPSSQADPSVKRLFALARSAAEQAKIDLSTATEAVIFVGEEEARLTDGNGRDVFVEVTITRADLERLIAPKVEESIELCRKVLADNGYAADDLDRVVLIGGPSKMPIVRERVPRELGVPADLTVDPMTAVARGAAIFAEGRNWTDVGAGGRKEARKRERSASARVSYDYEARTSKSQARIRVVAEGSADGLRVTAIDSAGRDHGERLVAEQPLFTVPLIDGENRVRMIVTDGSGEPVTDAGAELLITRVAAIAAGAPCTHSIAVKIVAGEGERARNALDPLIEKGATLPARGVRELRAAKRLNPGSNDFIDVELFQQAKGVPDPENNQFIGMLRLWATDLPPGQTLYEGDPVAIHWSVDESQLLLCSVELPQQGLHLDDRNFYVDSLARLDFAANGRQLADEAIVSLDTDVEALSELLGPGADEKVNKVRDRVNSLLDQSRHAEDPDAFRRVVEEARLIRQEMSRIRHDPQHRAPILRRELEKALRLHKALEDRLTDAGRLQFGRARFTAEEALLGHPVRIDVAEAAIEAMDAINREGLRSDPHFLARQFQFLAGRRHAAVDGAAFDRVVAEGEAALAAENADALRRANRSLYQLAPFPAEDGDAAAALAGLRR